jgi:hypothetical protein
VKIDTPKRNSENLGKERVARHAQRCAEMLQEQSAQGERRDFQMQLKIMAKNLLGGAGDHAAQRLRREPVHRSGGVGLVVIGGYPEELSSRSGIAKHAVEVRLLGS